MACFAKAADNRNHQTLSLHLNPTGMHRRPRTVLADSLALADFHRIRLRVPICFIWHLSITNDDDVLAFLPPDDPRVIEFHEVAEQFGMLNIALVGVQGKSGEFLSPRLSIDFVY